MTSLKKHFIIDKKGHKLGVILDIKEYELLKKQAEEFEEILAYDTNKKDASESIPFETAVQQIRKNKKK